MNNKVLVITDKEDDANILCKSLASAKDGPFTVQCVPNLAAGISAINDSETDIILVDFHLPDCHGIATFHELFGLFPSIPIMMLCGEEHENLAIEAVQNGAQGFLSKGHFQSSLVPQALRNIIQRKAVEEELFVETERARVTLESIGDGVISTDATGKITYLNAQAENMTGWHRDEAASRPIAEVFKIINSETRELASNPIADVIKYKKPLGLLANSILCRRDGYEVPIEDSVAPIFNRAGKVTGAVIVFHDVSKAKEMSQQMAHSAQHDYLTNLPNRVLFNDRLLQAVYYAKRHNTKLAILFLDLDKFKNINDSLGHSVGDKLLKSVSQCLTKNVRKSDTVCRQGGDEFVILIHEKDHAVNAAMTAEKIIKSLALPHLIDEHQLNITTSIGISLFPEDGNDPDTLIKNADIAMYHAKKNGRDNYQFFRTEMNVLAVQRQSIEAGLRRAIEREEFVLHYQPKVNLDSGEIIGAEALIRWNHPSKGMQLPEAFIAIAEDSGLIINMGRMVLRLACLQAKEWNGTGMPNITMAVNISALEFQHRDFIKFVREILQESKLEPKFLQLELTESVLMHNVESSTIILQQLKDMGVELAVDDFGTGYSSLSYLSQFPIDVLKIDQSFVRNMTSDSSNGAIVSAILSMGASLNQRVIAEGIETNEELSFLNARQCTQGQGYLFGWPVPSEIFTENLMERRA